MKILITGSEGFVGQHIISLLAKNNYDIIGLSKETKLETTNQVRYIIGDILDSDKMFAILKNFTPDVILHLAGIAKTWDNDPRLVFDINLYGTLNIYQSILKLKDSQGYNPKIIYVSSAEVYGNTTDTSQITEEFPLNPINEYASSKLAADRLSYQYTQSHKLNIVILRPFPHIGPGQKTGFFVPDVVSQIVEIENTPSKDTLFVGNLTTIRDYLDVRDVVEAYRLVIEKDFTPGEVFNICSGSGIKIADLLNLILKLTTKQIVLAKNPDLIRPVDLPTYVGSNQKLVAATGWKPQYSLENTLKDIIKYWRRTAAGMKNN